MHDERNHQQRKTAGKEPDDEISHYETERHLLSVSNRPCASLRENEDLLHF